MARGRKDSGDGGIRLRLPAVVPSMGPLPEGVTEAEHFAPKPYAPRDLTGCDVTDVYEHYGPPPPGFPRFRIVHYPRWEGQTDAQYAAARRSTEQHFRNLGVLLGLSQEAATFLGHFKDCPQRVCRRNKACSARRAEDDWTVFPGPMLPPCCNSCLRVDRVRAINNDVIAQGIARGR
jgi:hypothetical protein